MPSKEHSKFKKPASVDIMREFCGQMANDDAMKW